MWTYRCPPAASAAEPTPPKPLSAIPTQHPIGTIVQPPVSMASQKRQIPKTTTPKPEPTKQESVQPPAGSNAIKRKSVLGPAVIYLVGLAGGMFACQTLPQLAPFLTLYSQNLEQVQAGTGADMLFSLGFLGHIGVLLALFLCGLCAIGTPLIGLVFLLRGMWESAYLASFFAQSSWQALHHCILAARPDFSRISAAIRRRCAADLPSNPKELFADWRIIQFAARCKAVPITIPYLRGPRRVRRPAANRFLPALPRQPDLNVAPKRL